MGAELKAALWGLMTILRPLWTGLWYVPLSLFGGPTGLDSIPPSMDTMEGLDWADVQAPLYLGTRLTRAEGCMLDLGNYFR